MRTAFLFAPWLVTTAALAQPVVPPWGGLDATLPGVVTYTGPASDAAGTPRVIVVDPQGDVCATTLSQFSAIQGGALLVGVPTLTLGAATATTIPYTVNPGTGETPTAYEVGYRIAGSGAGFTFGTGSASVTGSITGLASSTAYDVEVLASNTACSQASAVVNASTTAAPLPTTVSSALLAADGLTLTMTFSQTVTLNPADISFFVAGVAVTATNSDAATSSSIHVFSLPSAATVGQAVTYTTTTTAFSAPALSTAASNAAVTNNSAVALVAPAQSAAGIGPALTIVNVAYDTTTPKFGTGALSGGTGTATVTLAAGTARSFEFWFKGGAPAANTYGALLNDPADNESVYIDPAGNISIGTSAGNTYTNHVVTDSVWHHIALSISSGAHNLFVDGVLLGSAGAGQAATSANPTLTIGAVSNFEIDEVAVFSVPRAGNFTPPTAPNTSVTTGIVAGWHLDGDGSSL